MHRLFEHLLESKHQKGMAQDGVRVRARARSRASARTRTRTRKHTRMRTRFSRRQLVDIEKITEKSLIFLDASSSTSKNHREIPDVPDASLLTSKKSPRNPRFSRRQLVDYEK